MVLLDLIVISISAI